MRDFINPVYMAYSYEAVLFVVYDEVVNVTKGKKNAIRLTHETQMQSADPEKT